jgi:hypothetical protein
VVGDYGIWALGLNAGEWSVIPGNPSLNVPGALVWAPLPKSIGRPDSVSPPKSTEEALAIELRSGIEYVSTSTSGAVLVSQVFVAGSAFLDLPPTPLVIEQYRRLSSSRSPNARIVGVIGLARQGDVPTLRELTRPAEIGGDSNLGARLFLAVRALRNDDPEVIQALGEIALAASALPPLPGMTKGFSTAAAEALAAIHSPAVLRFLAEMLNSPSAPVREFGVSGLTMFVKNLPVFRPEMVKDFSWQKPQGSTPYKTEETERYSAAPGLPSGKEAEYITFWKRWWVETGSKVRLSNP